MFAALCYNNWSCVPMSKDVTVYPDWGMVINPLMILMYILICTDGIWWWCTPSKRIPIHYAIDDHELCTRFLSIHMELLFKRWMVYGKSYQQLDHWWFLSPGSPPAHGQSLRPWKARAAFLRSSQQFNWSCFSNWGSTESCELSHMSNKNTGDMLEKLDLTRSKWIQMVNDWFCWLMHLFWW